MSSTETTEGRYESKREAFRKPADIVTFWLDAWDVASDQEKDWREKDADEAVRLYRMDSGSTPAFNILHSNVQVKVPAIYNSKPEPDVRPRDISNKNPQLAEAGRLGAQTVDMALRYQLDEYDFDALARSVALDGQVAGRGLARVDLKELLHDDAETGQKVVWQWTQCRRVPWRNFRRGPGLTWDEVPWMGVRHALTRDELIDLAGPEVGNEVNLDLTEVNPDAKGKSATAEADKVREISVFKRATVLEIWDKDTRRVFFIAPGYADGPLSVERDPYGLLGFFNFAVVQPISDPEGLTPVCPYRVYKRQAEELNEITERILALIPIIKFRGIRAAEISEFDDLDTLKDGQFLPSVGALALVGGAKGLSDAIWVVPLQDLITTVRELVLQRENVKQVIYELTGISDIMRGASDPNETLGAQQIKAQSGSLRAKVETDQMEAWCRDVLRMKAEIIANKFSPQTLAAIVGEKLAPQVEMVLRSDVLRHYLIDVETNSTIRGDLAKNQQNMAGFMQSMGAFIQTFMPLLQSGMFPPQMGPAVITIVSAFAKQFKLGKVVDDTLAQLEEAGKQWAEKASQPDPEKEAQKKEATELQRRGAIAEIAGSEAKALDIAMSAQKKAAEIDTMRHDARMGTATDLINIKKTRFEAEKSAKEVEAQEVETEQQRAALEGQVIDNRHKVERGPFEPDPNEKVKADAQVEIAKTSGASSVDAAKAGGAASVDAAREKARGDVESARVSKPDPDPEGFVQ